MRTGAWVSQRGHVTILAKGAACARYTRRPYSCSAARMIDVQGLGKCYGDFTAVDAVSFHVAAGQIMGLVGPNGAGKTTTLRCLAGIIPATTGHAFIGGVDIAADPVAAKRQLAFIPDEPRLFEHLTVEQHLNFVARLYGVSDWQQRVQPLLAELEMDDKRHLLPSELSRGMKQKLAIACGLLHAPRAVILDEPLTGLDPYGIRRMKNSMRRLAGEGVAIILSSHLLDLVEEVCTHLLILKDGRKLADGSVAEVRARYMADGAASLEDVFFRATGEPESAAESART